MGQKDPEHKRSDTALESGRSKPCLCQLPGVGRVFWRPTGNVKDLNLEFRCPMCGAQHWRQAN
jgi:hypothetical protein